MSSTALRTDTRKTCSFVSVRSSTAQEGRLCFDFFYTSSGLTPERNQTSSPPTIARHLTFVLTKFQLFLCHLYLVVLHWQHLNMRAAELRISEHLTAKLADVAIRYQTHIPCFFL